MPGWVQCHFKSALSMLWYSYPKITPIIETPFCLELLFKTQLVQFLFSCPFLFSIVPDIVLRDCPAYVIHCMACGEGLIKSNIYDTNIPDSKVHGANMGPTWFLSAPDGHHVGPMNLAIRDAMLWIFILCCVCLCSNKPPWGKSI